MVVVQVSGFLAGFGTEHILDDIDTLMNMEDSRLPDMSDWTDEQIAEFWETHDSTGYVDQMEEADVQIDVS